MAQRFGEVASSEIKHLELQAEPAPWQREAVVSWQGSLTMDMQQISHMARMLIEAHGDQALLAAARRQAEEERRGNRAEAEDWEKIRKVISERRGPRES